MRTRFWSVTFSKMLFVIAVVLVQIDLRSDEYCDEVARLVTYTCVYCLPEYLDCVLCTSASVMLTLVAEAKFDHWQPMRACYGSSHGRSAGTSCWKR